MNNKQMNQIEGFFRRLEAALGQPGPQNREVVEEVRADLMAQIDAVQQQGATESDAVERALASLGTPEGLAGEMKAVLPPLSSGWTRGLRYALSAALIVWTVCLLWTFRAWSYGIEFGPILAVALHLPVILLLWPGLVWRKNWLFGLIPAGIGVFAALLLNSLGIESSESIPLPLEGEAIETTEIPDEGLPWQAGVLLGTLLVAILVLWGALQQTRQRKMVLLAVIFPMLAVEGVFQWEEMQFRKQRNQLALLLQESGENLPTKGSLTEAGVAGIGSGKATFLVREGRKEFTIWWSRPLSSGFALCYSSEDGKTWVND